MLGIIDSAKDLQLDIKTFIDQSETGNAQSRINTLRDYLNENSEWNILNLCNIATLNREYQVNV